MGKYYTIVRNALVVDCENKSMQSVDILMNAVDGIIENVGKDIQIPPDVTALEINAKNRIVCPAFTDLHTYTGEPVRIYRDTIAATMSSAFFGGYANALIIPEALDDGRSDNVTRYIISHAKNSGCRALAASPIVRHERTRDVLVDFQAMEREGAKAFTNDSCPYIQSGMLKEAMLRIKGTNLPLIYRCRDASLSQGSVNEGAVSKALKTKGISASCETLEVARAIILARETGCSVHLALLSSEDSFSMVREAKKKGIPITCSVPASSYAYTETDLYFYGANVKTDPPLRSEYDRIAVIEAIQDGTVDCISSDHTPCAKEEKNRSISEAAFGAVSLQTVFPSVVSSLIHTGHIDIFRAVELLSYAPAKILNIPVGIEKGMPADINILSLDDDVNITERFLKSGAKNTPYLTRTLKGKVVETLSGGKRIDISRHR